MKNIVLRVLCWPLYFGALLVLIIRALWGSSSRWENGVLMVRLSETSWPMRSWYKPWGGTTFGFGMMLSPTAGDSIVEHEMVHVEQAEAATIAGLALGLGVFAVSSGHWWAGLAALAVCWAMSWPLTYVAASLTAWLRSEPNVYRNNHLEEAAYNATDAKCRQRP